MNKWQRLVSLSCFSSLLEPSNIVTAKEQVIGLYHDVILCSKCNRAFKSIRGVSVYILVGSTEAPSKDFPLFFLFSDWLKSNHLKSRIERGVLHIFRAIFVAL